MTEWVWYSKTWISFTTYFTQSPFALVYIKWNSIARSNVVEFSIRCNDCFMTLRLRKFYTSNYWTTLYHRLVRRGRKISTLYLSKKLPRSFTSDKYPIKFFKILHLIYSYAQWCIKLSCANGQGPDLGCPKWTTR